MRDYLKYELDISLSNGQKTKTMSVIQRNLQRMAHFKKKNKKTLDDIKKLLYEVK